MPTQDTQPVIDRQQLLQKVRELEVLLIAIDEQAREQLEPRWQRAEANLKALDERERRGEFVSYLDTEDTLLELLQYANDQIAHVRLLAGLAMGYRKALEDVLTAEDEVRTDAIVKNLPIQ
jgi:hypothetical protein